MTQPGKFKLLGNFYGFSTYFQNLMLKLTFSKKLLSSTQNSQS